jgi:flap endonuclease-1
LFLEYPTTDDYDLDWKVPDEEKVLRFLCDERDFSKDRVKKVMEKLQTGIGEVKSQSSLDNWF